MIVIRVSFERKKELDAVLDGLKTTTEVRKVKHSKEGHGRYQKAYITLELKPDSVL